MIPAERARDNVAAATAALEAAATRSARQMNTGRKEAPIYKKGDLVYIHRSALSASARKLDAHYHGPFRVAEVLSPKNIKVIFKPGTYTRTHSTFNVDRVKPYRGDVENAPEPPPWDVDEFGEPVWLVEKILKERKIGKRNHQVLVRWKNYSPKHDSWEPIAELQHNDAYAAYKAQK